MLTSKNGIRHLLVRLEALENKKSSGVYVTVDGNKKAQEAYLIKMAKKYEEQIRTSQCTPNMAMYTYNP